jgi:hypothetical protein
MISSKNRPEISDLAPSLSASYFQRRNPPLNGTLIGTSLPLPLPPPPPPSEPDRKVTQVMFNHKDTSFDSRQLCLSTTQTKYIFFENSRSSRSGDRDVKFWISLILFSFFYYFFRNAGAQRVLNVFQQVVSLSFSVGDRAY